MKKSLAIFAVALLMSGTMLIAGCNGGKHEAASSGRGTNVAKGVVLETVQLRELSERQEAVGTVKAVTTALVAARVAGTITGITVKEGDRVRKGELLATIEASETAAGAAAAQAGVEEAKRALDEARARKKLAEATFQRYRNLFAEQAVTRQEFENRQSEQEIAIQGVGRAESRLVQAGQVSRSAATVAGYARVLAPLSGLVTSKSVDRGVTVFPGMPLITIEEDSGYRLEVQVPESLKSGIALSQIVEVVLEGSSGTQQGRIVEIVPVIDPATRTFMVKVELKIKGLRSGAYGKVFFPVGTTKGLMLLRSAVVERGSLTSVWVVDGQNIARMRLVKLGRIINDRVEILAGLSNGERIVIGGIEKISDGTKVE